MYQFTKTDHLTSRQKQNLLELWNSEYPEKLAHKSMPDFDVYLNGLGKINHILVTENEKTTGWYFDFIRDNDRWFAMILSSKIQGKGIGTQLLDEAKKDHTALNGWVIDHDRDQRINGTIYHSPIEFYLKNGFERLDAVRLETEMISAVKIQWKKGTDK